MSCRSELAQRTPAVTACEPLCGTLERSESPSPTENNAGRIEAVSSKERGTIGEAG